jgi:tetratricopeptide (TPR) repeat protein
VLVRKELIRPHEVIEDTFRFRHMLIRDAAYERIPKELRSELHERFAGWLDGRGEEFEEIVGYHLEQAYRCVVELGPAGDRARALAERAADCLAASGRQAYARGDTPAATNLLERASALLPADDRRRLNLLPSLGRALMDAGELERADSVLSEAIERGRAAGERAVPADAAVALSYLRLHTAPQPTYDNASQDLDDAIRVFEELGDEAGLARALGLAGILRFWRGEAAAAIEELERAARYARQVGHHTQEAESLRYVLVANLMGPTPVNEALGRVEEIRSRREANRRIEVALLRTRGQLEAMQGRFDVARDLIAQAKALAEELGLEFNITGGAAQAGIIELLAGDASGAERELRPACEALERIGSWSDLVTAASMLADALFIQGRDEEALRLTELAERLASPQDVDAEIRWRRVRAKVLARRVDIEEAERLAREATALGARTDYVDLHAQAVADLAEVLRLAGRLEEAAAATAEAVRLDEEKGNIAGAALLARTSASAPR